MDLPSVDRRRAIAAGAAAVTAAWVAPSVVKLDSVAASQPSCKYDFTTGLGGWTIDNTRPATNYSGGANANGLWNRSSARSFSSSHSLHYGRGIGGNYVTGGGAGTSNAGQVTSELIKLPTSGAMTLSFRVWRAVENLSPWDRLSFSILDTVAPGNAVLWSSSTTTGGAWQLITLTIPAGYLNHSVQFRFTFETGDNVFNNFEGVYIDNVYIPCRVKPPGYARFAALPGAAEFPPPPTDFTPRDGG